MKTGTEFSVEGPNVHGGYHVKRVEWAPTPRGTNRGAYLHSKHATQAEALVAAGLASS